MWGLKGHYSEKVELEVYLERFCFVFGFFQGRKWILFLLLMILPFSLGKRKKEGEILESHGDMINTWTRTNKSLRPSTQKIKDSGSGSVTHQPCTHGKPCKPQFIYNVKIMILALPSLKDFVRIKRDNVCEISKSMGSQMIHEFLRARFYEKLHLRVSLEIKKLHGSWLWQRVGWT